MTAAQVVETSVTVNNKSPIQDYVHPDDHTQPTYGMTPGFKPFTLLCKLFTLHSLRHLFSTSPALQLPHNIFRTIVLKTGIQKTS